VPRHLLALVPGDGAEQLAGQLGDGPAHRGVDLVGLPALGQVEQQDIAGGPLHEGAHCRPPTLADDQVALPVTGNSPVVGLGWALADHDHVGEPALDRASTLGAAPGPASAQAPGQFSAQLTAPLHE